jgi:hypothetical protein
VGITVGNLPTSMSIQACCTAVIVIAPKHTMKRLPNFWQAPAGTLAPNESSSDFVVHVGGGQPRFTEGVLNRTVTVKSSGKLSSAFRCF